MKASLSWYHESWAIQPKPPLSEWADANRYLSLESNPTGGRWHTDTVPYTREPMDTITDSPYEEISLMWPSQAAKTEIQNNLIGWIMDVDPGPTLLIQETIENARSWSKDRLEPMLRDTPCLHGKIKTSRGIAQQESIASNEVLHKSFPGGHLTIVGSNSGAGLSMRPIRYILADEIDAWAPSAGEEGDQLDLATKRTTWFYNRKIVAISSPRIKATSRIEPRFLASDQRRLYVPCPHCGFYQQLLWDNFDFSERDDDGRPISEAIHFLCQECKRRIEERHRPAMLTECQWRAKFPGRPTAGFWLWAIYCPPVPWATLANEYVEAQGKPEKMKVFVNTRKAETWEEAGDAPEWETIRDRAEPYEQWIVPHGVGILVAAADVQDDRIEFSIWGFGREEESWLIGHDVVWGNTNLDDPYLAFEQKAFLPLTQPTRQQQLQPLLAFIDSGHQTQQVYSFVRTRPHLYAIKGANQRFAPIVGSPSRQDVNYRGQKINAGVQLWPIGVHRIKKLLYGRLKLKKPGPRFIHFPHNLPDSYYRGLTVEKLIVHANGREEFKPAPLNEPLDCATYCYAAAVLAGLTDPRTDWDQLCPASESESETAPGPVQSPIAIQLATPQQPLAARQRRMRSGGGVMGRMLR